MLQVNRLDKDNGGLRDENNRLATLLAERQPLVDHLRSTVDALQEVAPPEQPLLAERTFGSLLMCTACQHTAQSMLTICTGALLELLCRPSATSMQEDSGR